MNYITAKTAQLPITVFYDHSCVMCRSEILHLKARDSGDALRLVDCSAASFDDANLPVKRAHMMDCIHAQDAKGQWLCATEVFVAIYGAVGLHTMAAGWRLGKPVAERIYPWVVRNRHTLSKLGIHKVFNALTERHLKKQARAQTQAQAQAQAAMRKSQTCKDGACEVGTQATDEKTIGIRTSTGVKA